MIEQKFVKDFFDAYEIDKAIAKNEIYIGHGVHMLKQLLIYVRKDVQTLDSAAYDQLKEKNKKLDADYDKKKKQIKHLYGQGEDTIEDRTIKHQLLEEDHKRYRHELFYLQDMAHAKGWFDAYTQ